MGGGAASPSLSSSGWRSARLDSVGVFLLFTLQKEKKLTIVSIKEAQGDIGLTSYHRDLSGCLRICQYPDERTASTPMGDSSNPAAVESNTQTSICLFGVRKFCKSEERHSRETLNHFKRMRRMPDTALAVISRDLIASISSIGSSAGSTVFCVGKGISAGSCALFWPGTPVRRLISDRNAGARP